MTGTPNAKAGRAEKGSWVLVGHHEGRMCLMHSTHLMVKFFGFLRFFFGRGELGGSILPDAKEQHCVANDTATGRKVTCRICQISNQEELI